MPKGKKVTDAKPDIQIAQGYLICGECGGIRGPGFQQDPHRPGCVSPKANLQPGVLTV